MLKPLLYLTLCFQLGCQNQAPEKDSSPHTTQANNAEKSTKDHNHNHDHSFDKVTALSPQDSLAAMLLQDDFKAELVAHEPMVEEPVLMTFDGKGRMYVAEMLTYMIDADGTGQMEPVSRIKRLEDTNNDGR